MKTEKVCVNLTPTELGQIDLLIERGLYDSRSDFMRTAARRQLEGYAADIQQFLEPTNLQSDEKIGLMWSLGISGLTKSQITELIAKGNKVHIRSIGLFTVSSKATVEEIHQVVDSCKVYGKLVANPEIKAALQEIEESRN